MHPLKGLKDIKKSGLLDEKRFYRLLSERCNYVGEENVKDFYIALVKLISHELRENGIIRLPHLGDFALVKQKDKVGLAGTQKVFVKGAHMLKFYVNYALKSYFSKLGETTDTLDPREKFKKRNLM